MPPLTNVQPQSLVSDLSYYQTAAALLFANPDNPLKLTDKERAEAKRLAEQILSADAENALRQYELSSMVEGWSPAGVGARVQGGAPEEVLIAQADRLAKIWGGPAGADAAQLSKFPGILASEEAIPGDFDDMSTETLALYLPKLVNKKPAPEDQARAVAELEAISSAAERSRDGWLAAFAIVLANPARQKTLAGELEKVVDTTRGPARYRAPLRQVVGLPPDPDQD